MNLIKNYICENWFLMNIEEIKFLIIDYIFIGIVFIIFKIYYINFKGVWL